MYWFDSQSGRLAGGSGLLGKGVDEVRFGERADLLSMPFTHLMRAIVPQHHLVNDSAWRLLSYSAGNLLLADDCAF